MSLLCCFRILFFIKSTYLAVYLSYSGVCILELDCFKFGTMKNLTQFMCFVILTLAFSCKKDPEITVPEPEQELTLTDMLSGTYKGTRERTDEDIACQNCSPPCNIDYTHHNDSIEIQIIKHNNDSIEIVDLLDGTASRIIAIDSTLMYSGYPPYNAPNGHYDLEFKGANHDSLIMELDYGGGNSCYANFYYADYVLMKQ